MAPATKITFAPATKEQRKLRMALVGYEGQGKTWTALAIASRLAEWAGGKVAFGDTEGGSARIYADRFAFDVVELNDHTPEHYVDLIHAADAAGYKVLVIDSLSHEWIGAGGLLEQVDEAKARGGPGWDKATPRHRKVFEAILASKLHIIATMRQKKEYAVESENGKIKMRLLGTAPVQREGSEFEFDVIGTLQDATMSITKSRVSAMPTGKQYVRPGADVADLLITFLESGVKPAEKPAADAAGIPDVAPAPEGDPIPENVKAAIQEAMGVIDPARKEVARKALADKITADGYTSWADFLRRGKGKAAELILLLHTYDRANHDNGIPQLVLAEPLPTEGGRS